jgi:FLVCR family MFS transporter 7
MAAPFIDSSSPSEGVPPEETVTDAAEEEENESLVERQSSEALYVAEPRRWVVLAAFAFANFSNSMMWVSFAPIATLTESYFGISITAVNFFSVAYLAAYVPGSLISLYIYSNKENGLRTGIVLATLVSAVGAFLRYFSSVFPATKPSYGLALTGQCLAAICNPLIQNIIPKVTGAWFPAKERDIGTVIGSMAGLVGIAVGSVLPSIFVTQDEKTLLVSGFNVLLLTEAIIMALSAVAAVFFIQSHPNTPPSAAAEKELQREETESTFEVLWKNVVLCFRNKHFCILFISFGIALGLFNAMASVAEQLIRPFCYNEDDASLFTGLLIGCGIVSAFFVGFYLDRSHQYRLVLKAGFCLATLGFLSYSLLLRPNDTVGLAISFAVMGATMIPMLPTILEAAVECTYPVPEEYSAGLILSAGQITGIAYIFALEALADRQPSCEKNDGNYYFASASGLIIVFACAATSIMLTYKGPLLRLEAEEEMGVAVARDMDDDDEEEEGQGDQLTSQIITNPITLGTSELHKALVSRI